MAGGFDRARQRQTVCVPRMHKVTPNATQYSLDRINTPGDRGFTGFLGGGLSPRHRRFRLEEDVEQQFDD